MSHSTSYGDDEQRRSVPARCDPMLQLFTNELLTVDRGATLKSKRKCSQILHAYRNSE
ncbi:hypothetical protein [Nitrosomonas sp. Nm51]|uniref:hypothetical protein n=1 Tax=Nitrosomonas sp. Nm51 TaxID=133720 RepID=UPI0015A5F567|nr:hypothetical protein [Nitrosomonas sp. Nm51]